MKNIRIKILVLFVILGCEDSINESSESNPPNLFDEYEIVFNSNRDGDDEIYVMNEDGSNQTRLTENDVKDWYPKWSPNGERIAYFSEIDGQKQVLIMNKDGSGQKQISFDLNIDTEINWLEWSRDGTKILIQTLAEQQDPRLINRKKDIYIINANGSNQTFLVEGYYPNWVDDIKIIFGQLGNGGGISSISFDGSSYNQLITQHNDSFPVVSDNHKKIIFESYRNNTSGSTSLHIMNLDGSNIEELTEAKYLRYILRPTFSPVDPQVLIVAPSSWYSEDAIIYQIDFNGENMETFFNINGYVNSAPDYSPQGDKVVFSAYKNGKASNIYLRNLSTKETILLTKDEDSQLTNNFPDWNPIK